MALRRQSVELQRCVEAALIFFKKFCGLLVNRFHHLSASGCKKLDLLITDK